MSRKRNKLAPPGRRRSCERCKGSGLIPAKDWFRNRAGLLELMDCMAQCPDCVIRPDAVQTSAGSAAPAPTLLDQAQRAAGEREEA